MSSISRFNWIIRFMKGKTLFLTFITFMSLSLQAQDFINQFNQFNKQFPQEKIYLHIDRPSYWADDDIWFKAYLKYSPKPNSNLYVELLNEKGAVIYKKTCWAEGGLAYGDIHLADTLSSGIYQVRAYTNWMRNFDEQWFYRKDLLIWNLRDKAKSKEQAELKTWKVDLQFMPEGGTFLAGIINRVAFKAVDIKGKGLEVEGVIVDDKGRQVAMIKSGFKGMGSFEITPQAGIKYSAEVTISGDLPMKAELPFAANSGARISFDLKDTTHIHLEVQELGAASLGKYLLVAQAEGEVCFKEEISIQDSKESINIDKAKLPTGINRFTLFDKEGLPRCERLIFVNNHDQINLSIEAEEAEYHSRDKVVLDISALGKNGAPQLANLSVSVYPT